ncbi:hypothetical protein [Oceanobacillus timonensis]|uniref:hypothetical protein n=1 Tax=Oceanobacillus timonensis TaxID=1926285 RepID=UPI0009BACE4C|nr:hypothetical protein [Oceanobacillus timonensis]
MRIYHLGALFMICLSLGVSIGYSFGRTEMGAFAGLVLGIIPIVIYRRAVIKREKNVRSEKQKTSYI